MFGRNLKKKKQKSSKNRKNGSKGSNVATSYGECHASYCNVAASVEIDRSEFSNVVTSPRHRLRHHSKLKHQKSNVATLGKDCKSINQQCREITMTLAATSAWA